MFTVTIDDAMLQKLRTMLEEEDEGTCVRLREYKVGGGCHSKITLGLGMDAADEEEDVKTRIHDVPFVAEKDFLLKHGNEFSLSFCEDKGVVVTATAE